MDLHVAADDRTGAFEAAAALADAGTGPVPVVVWPDSGATGLVVTDLGSRHLSPSEAAERAADLDRPVTCAHKIDSTLRGNWADELVGRQRATGRPVLLVPALPALGRTCAGGVVLDHGRPVHEGSAGSDVRRRVTTSRPADTLLVAGADPVAELTDGDVEGWLTEPSGIAVADASSDADIAGLVRAWRTHPDIVVAGTSAVVGAVGEVLRDHDAIAPPAMPALPGPALVVCGSVHPAARAQIAYAEHRGVPVAALVDELTVRVLERADHLILATEIPVGDVDEPVAVAAASGLARGVGDIRHRLELGALVLIGGDTAAAVLDGAEVVVNGSVAEGTAWATVAGYDMPVLTRSGGFGSERALVELLSILRSP